MRSIYIVDFAVILLSSTAGNFAYAQTAPVDAERIDASRDEEFDTIVVTARRREEDIQSVPVAITAVSGERLAQSGVTSLRELAVVAPSILLEGAAGRRLSPAIGIRGQRFGDTLMSSDPAVAIYSDEVVVSPTQGSNLGFYDTQSVQVLKGPQGTLFGRNTTGGALLVTTNKPTDRFEGGLTGRLGNYDEAALTGFLNLPVSETLAVRLAGNFVRHDGYSHAVAGAQAGHEYGSENNRSARGIIHWSPGSVLANTLIVSYDHGKSGASANILQAINPASTARLYNNATLGDVFAALALQQARSPREIEADHPTYERAEAAAVTNITTLDVGEVTLKNIFGYRDLKYRHAYEGDGTALPIFGTQGAVGTKQYSEELNLSGTAFDDRTKWIAGVYYYRLTGSDIAQTTSFIGVNPNAPSISGGFVNQSSLSGYIQQTTEILPRLSLTTGLRYSSDRRRAKSIAFTAPNAQNPNVCQEFDANGGRLPFNACFNPASTSFAKPTWTVTADYKLGDEQLIYLTTRRGYRSGGINLRGVNPIQLTPFRPETVTDFEGGIKLDFELGGWKIRTNAAGYYQKYKDIQRAVPQINPLTGNTTSSIFNAAEGTIYGGEIEITVIPTSGLNINLSYSYTNPKYDEFSTANGDYSDRKFAFIPKHQFNAGVSYKVPADDAFGDVTISGNYSYRSAIYTSETFQTAEQVRTQGGYPANLAALIPDQIPGMKLPGFGLFNTRLSWDRVLESQFSIAFYAKNLTNKLYRSGGLSLYENVGLVYSTYGDARTYGVEVGVKF